MRSRKKVFLFAALCLFVARVGDAQLVGTNGCHNLLVFIQSTSPDPATVEVQCTHGYFVEGGDVLTFGSPTYIVLQQSLAYGPDCTIVVAQGTSSATLSVQQNFCYAEAGDITASATGSATMTGSYVGGFVAELNGIVTFIFDPSLGGPPQ